MTRLILCVILFAAPAGAAPKRLVCTNPETDEKIQINVTKVSRDLKGLKRQLQKRQIHVLDLPEDAQDRRRRLDFDISADDWCKVASHVREIEDALYALRIHDAFVSEKFSRIERWLRAGVWDPATKLTVERNIANAAAHISAGKYEAANKQLSKAILTLFALRTNWDVPESVPEIKEGVAGKRGRVEIDQYEVEEGCPKLAKLGRGKREDLVDVLGRLRRLMNKRQIRSVDSKGG